MENAVTPRKRCRTLSSVTALKTVNPDLSPNNHAKGLCVPAVISEANTGTLNSPTKSRERTSSFVIQRDSLPMSIHGKSPLRSGSGLLVQPGTKSYTASRQLFARGSGDDSIYRKDRKKLLYFAILMKLFIIVVALGAYYSQKSFDLSGDVFVDFYKKSSTVHDFGKGNGLTDDDSGNEGVFWRQFESYLMDGMKPFVRWDALYFLGISENGYTFEQQHAFFPLLPMLIRLVRETLLTPLSSVLCPMARNMLAGLLISNVSFILAALSFYK